MIINLVQDVYLKESHDRLPKAATAGGRSIGLGSSEVRRRSRFLCSLLTTSVPHFHPYRPSLQS
jgi:hypothetical protein